VRVLGASVLAMESLVMGFALLLAMDKQSGFEIALGAILALLILLTAGMTKRVSGWILGSIWQICLIAYGMVVPSMYFMGALFALLWVCAYFVGKKGERARAQMMDTLGPWKEPSS